MRCLSAPLLVTCLLLMLIKKTKACSGTVDLSGVLDLAARKFSNNPTYPTGSYPKNARCRWIIQSRDNELLQITFTDLVIEQVWSGDDCGFDSLRIYELDMITYRRVQNVEPCSKALNGLRQKGPICKLPSLPAIHSARTNLTMIEFCSDESVEERGFLATFDQISKTSHDNIVPHNSGLFPVDGDILIASSVDDSGKHYLSDQWLTWNLMAAENETLSLTFRRFELEDGLNCEYDAVTIYDGDSSAAPVLGRFCSSNKTYRHVRTSTNVAVIEFRTDSWLEKGGFLLAASAVPCMAGTFFCGASDVCIPNSKLCDGKKDCRDGRDETACGTRCGIQYIPPRQNISAGSLNRIVGGNEALPHSWPWQVALKWDIGEPFCGGTLIHPRFVVTAAHCIDGIDFEVLRIRLGSHDLTGEEYLAEDAVVDRIIKHPMFSKPTNENDIALIRLTKPVRLRNEILPVCIPRDAADGVPTGTICVATGWGDTEGYTGRRIRNQDNFPPTRKTIDEEEEEEEEEEDPVLPRVLNEVRLPVLSQEVCGTSYGSRLTDKMLCAGYMAGGKDACQGDSGGPLVCQQEGRWKLYGVTSWGDGCASPAFPGLYTRVTTYVSWIENTMTELSSEHQSRY